MANKKGPPKGTVNNPKGVNQYSKGSKTRWTPGKSNINYPSKTLNKPINLKDLPKRTLKQMRSEYKNAHPERKKQLENWSRKDLNSMTAYVKSIPKRLKP